MSHYGAGVAAGFLATVAMSLVMVMKDSMRLVPEMDLIGMLSGMMKTSRPMGWMAHFVMGTVVYGLVYAWLFAPVWPGAYWLSGIIIGLVGWIIAGGMLMPMAGKGAFGAASGPKVPIASFLIHVLFGVVLGAIYGAFVR